MSSENVVHIKLDYDEAIRAKRNFLFSELSSLNVAKRIGRYKFLRLEELATKARLYTRMKEVRSNIKKLQNLLPTPTIPRILKRVKREEEQLEVRGKKHEQEDIESQLRDIQDRLLALQE